MLHTHDQDDGWVFVCTLLVIDVATRFKDGRSLTSRNSLEIWIAIKDIYEDPSNPLTWPKLLMTDGDASFRGAFSRGMEQYNVQYVLLTFIVLRAWLLLKRLRKE